MASVSPKSRSFREYKPELHDTGSHTHTHIWCLYPGVFFFIFHFAFLIIAINLSFDLTFALCFFIICFFRQDRFSLCLCLCVASSSLWFPHTLHHMMRWLITPPSSSAVCQQERSRSSVGRTVGAARLQQSSSWPTKPPFGHGSRPLCFMPLWTVEPRWKISQRLRCHP